MADKYTPKQAPSGQTWLRDWWKAVVEGNFTEIYKAFCGHISGASDVHTAEHIQMDSGQTLAEVCRHLVTEEQLRETVLTKDNLEEYTPKGMYQPATKKYVDDSVSEIINGEGNLIHSGRIRAFDLSVSIMHSMGGDDPRADLAIERWLIPPEALGGVTHWRVRPKGGTWSDTAAITEPLEIRTEQNNGDPPSESTEWEAELYDSAEGLRMYDAIEVERDPGFDPTFVPLGERAMGIPARMAVPKVYEYLTKAIAQAAAKTVLNDPVVVPALIKGYGTTGAFRMFAEANGETDTLTNITERFFEAAAKSVTETYATRFYKFNTSNTTLGAKTQDNADLVCEPSTIAQAGRDDYAELPLFACLDCNYTIDAKTLEPVIHAVKDVYGAFSSTPEDSLVGVIQMTGWIRRTSTDATKTVEYRAQKTEGFVPLPEAVRASDNSVRPYAIHAKYAAGLNKSGQISSIAGAQPVTTRPGSVGTADVSHDGQIALWQKKGNQYGGFALCDIAFCQTMLEIKYAVLGNAEVLSGCRSYSQSYTAAVSESGVKRVLLTEEQGGAFVVGSCVSLGFGNNRGDVSCYNVCDIARIVSIDDVQVDGARYKAIVLDVDETFNVSKGVTYITTQPWQTGSTDTVQGNDGSPTNSTSGKEPFKLQGIELMLGTCEVPMDTVMQEGAEDKYTAYTNRRAGHCKAGGSGTDPVVVGDIPKETAAGWKYVAELNWDANDQEAYMLGQQYGAASTTGYRAAQYLSGTANPTGWREWRAFGDLAYGGGGLASTNLFSALGVSGWSTGARACGTGGNRGKYVE